MASTTRCAPWLSNWRRPVRAARYVSSSVNLFPGLVSAEDLRFLKEVAADFAMPATLFPDYSETLDGESMEKYHKIPEGGTTIAALRATSSAKASIEFGRTLRAKSTAASFLQERFAVPATRIGLPIGVHESDAFFAAMEELTGQRDSGKIPAGARTVGGRLRGRAQVSVRQAGDCLRR